ncbi:MAG TPA: hypothetical protein VFM86_00615 [Pedococcus sp.]|nr:hypothetical protein [Pedococcus sp.]
MSSQLFDPPVTARVALAQEGEDLTSETIARAIRDDGVTHAALRAGRHLSSSALGTVDHELGAVAQQLLDIDLGDALLKAWRSYWSLVEAGRRTAACPGSEEVVGLVSHRITAEFKPSVDLFVDSLLVHTFEFELRLTFELGAVEAVVALGALTQLQGGGGTVKATLGLDGATIREGKCVIPPMVRVRLSPPVRLLERTAPPLEST